MTEYIELVQKRGELNRRGEKRRQDEVDVVSFLQTTQVDTEKIAADLSALNTAAGLTTYWDSPEAKKTLQSKRW